MVKISFKGSLDGQGEKKALSGDWVTDRWEAVEGTFLTDVSLHLSATLYDDPWILLTPAASASFSLTCSIATVHGPRGQLS